MAGPRKVRYGDVAGLGVPFLWVVANQSDTEELTNGVCQGILVLEGGDNVGAVCMSPNDDAITFTAIPAGTFIQGAFTRIDDTLTTADIVYCAYSVDTNDE